MVVLFEQAGVVLGVLAVGLLLLIAALVVAIVLLLRSLRLSRPAPLVADPAVPRLTADVRAGGEQIVLSLARSLGIAASRNEASYGELYVIASRENLLRIGSRSEIGRGFAGEVRIRRTPDGSRVEYVVLALPGDEELHARVYRVDEQIAEGLRNVDRSARIQRPRPVRPLL